MPAPAPRTVKAADTDFAGDRAIGNMMYEATGSIDLIHFFVASASMEGRRADALKAADEVVAKMPAEMLRDPAMGGMVQHMRLTPLFTKMRFGLWSDVLAEPAPPVDRRTCAPCGTPLADSRSRLRAGWRRQGTVGPRVWRTIRPRRHTSRASTRIRDRTIAGRRARAIAVARAASTSRLMAAVAEDGLIHGVARLADSCALGKTLRRSDYRRRDKLRPA